VNVTSQLVLNIQLEYAFETTSYGSVLVSHTDKVKNGKIRKERHLYEGTKITRKSTALIPVTVYRVIEMCVHFERRKRDVPPKISLNSGVATTYGVAVQRY
jgi:hypothetical protein